MQSTRTRVPRAGDCLVRRLNAGKIISPHVGLLETRLYITGEIDER